MKKWLIEKKLFHYLLQRKSLSTTKVYSAKTLLQLAKSTDLPTELNEVVAEGETLVKIVKTARQRSKPTDTMLNTSSQKVLSRYEQIQNQYPAYFILLQVGDFFEIYGERADHAAKILDIAVGFTKNRTPIKMTGFPVRSLDGYLERFIKAGHSVVICEQRISGGVIVRDISRVVTPGTLTEENLLHGGSNNFLLSIVGFSGLYSLAWIDISTGYFRTISTKGESLSDHLLRLNPREILLDERLKDDPLVRTFWRHSRATVHSISVSDPEEAANTLQSIFEGSHERVMVELDNLDQGETLACSVILDYIVLTQLQQKPFIELPQRFEQDKCMLLDSSALRALEIVKGGSSAIIMGERESNEDDNRSSSLLGVLDMTKTAVGARLLSDRLSKKVEISHLL